MKCHICGQEVTTNNSLAECVMVTFYSQEEMENVVVACSVDEHRQQFFCHEDCVDNQQDLNPASFMWSCFESWKAGKSDCDCEICTFFKQS